MFLFNWYQIVASVLIAYVVRFRISLSISEIKRRNLHQVNTILKINFLVVEHGEDLNAVAQELFGHILWSLVYLDYDNYLDESIQEQISENFEADSKISSFGNLVSCTNHTSLEGKRIRDKEDYRQRTKR